MKQLAGTRGCRSSRPARCRPRLGVLATHVIQYHAPLYQELSRRSLVDLEVAILSQLGARPFSDPEFGVTLAWDVDLLSGYRSTVLECGSPGGRARWLFGLSEWLRRQDIVVLHGHTNPEMLLATALCRALRVPYLLRGESPAETSATGWRCAARHLLASFTVSGAAGALPIGQRNADFYHRYGNIPQFRAPYSVDDRRFRAVSAARRPERAERLASLGLDPGRPTAIFSGRLTPRKRPLDAVRAIQRCGNEINLLVLGDGPLREQARHFETEFPVRCPGFVNQADLPGWYACGDMLVLPSEKETWGVVVNEGMACGLVPVVSDAVGCGPDLVNGIGEIVPVGNVSELAAALVKVSRELDARRERMERRLGEYGLAQTARGYEQAALALHRPHAHA
jgi:glycosyltransferase involved in cell wall biosynthesis